MRKRIFTRLTDKQKQQKAREKKRQEKEKQLRAQERNRIRNYKEFLTEYDDKTLIKMVIDQQKLYYYDKRDFELMKAELFRRGAQVRWQYYYNFLVSYGLGDDITSDDVKPKITKQLFSTITRKVKETKNITAIMDYLFILESLSRENDLKDFNLYSITTLKNFAKLIAEEYSLEDNLLFIETFPEASKVCDERILNSGNVEAITRFVIFKGDKLSAEKLKEIEKMVLASKDPELCESFSEVEGADIEALRKVVIASKSAKHNRYFIMSHDFTTAQLRKHYQAILESTDADKFKQACFLAEEYHTKLDVDKLKVMVLEAKDADACAMLCAIPGYADKELLKYALKTKNMSYLRWMLQNCEIGKEKIQKRLDTLMEATRKKEDGVEV